MPTVTVPVTPIPKPRMTRSDKWKKRPCVERYWAYKDALRAAVELPDGLDNLMCRFYLPLPKSWSKKKKAAMAGAGHRQRPDIDNLTKAVFDSLLAEDSGIAYSVNCKMWEDEKGPRVEIIWRTEDV